MNPHPVADLTDLPEQGPLMVKVKGLEVGILRVEGEFFAFHNRCPHRGAPICKGKVGGTVNSTKPGEYLYERESEYLLCPWHGWEFELETGKNKLDPRFRLKSFRVEAIDGKICVYL